MPGNTARVGVQTTGVGKASSELDKLNAKFHKLNQTTGKGLLTGIAAGATLGAIGLVTTAISKTVDVMGDAINAAKEDEASQQKLGTALAANIPQWDGQTKAIEDTIRARMKLGFADEEQRDSLAKLVAATHDVNDALKIQRTAMDLARFKGISLAEATDALTKVEAGSYRILKSLGISLKDGATAQEAMNAVQKVATGQAADYAKTTAGKTVVAQTQFNEALETAGYTLLPVVTEALNTLSKAMDSTAISYADVTAAANKGSEAARFHAIIMEQQGHGWADFQDTLSRGERSYHDTLDGMTSNLHQWVQKNEDGTDRVIVSFDDMVSALKNDAEDLIDKVYAPSEEKAKLTADRIEAANLRREISSGKLTRAEVRDARTRLREIQKDTDEQRLALLSSGDLSVSDARTWLAQLRKRYKKEMGSAKEATGDLIREVQRLMDLTEGTDITVKVSGQVENKNRQKGRRGASGGPHSGQTLVGELGPEIVDLPPGSFVNDARKSAAMMQGGDTYNLTFVGSGQMSERSIIGAVERMRAISRGRRKAA